MISRANDDFGQAEPARFAQTRRCQRFACLFVHVLLRPNGGGNSYGRVTARRDPFAFGTLGGGRGGSPTPEDLAVSRMAQSYWVNFAKTGDQIARDYRLGRATPDKINLHLAPMVRECRSDVRKARLDVTEKATESGKRRP